MEKLSEIAPKTGIEAFGETQEMLQQLSAQVMQIKIVDETSLAIANQNLSKVNNHLKLIEEKRVELKAPYLKAGKDIDDAAKKLTSGLTAAINYLKKEILDWNAEVTRKEAEARKKAEEEAQKNEDLRRVEYLTKVKDWLKEQFEISTSIEHCQALLESIKGLQPVSVMGKYAVEYSSLIEMYNSLLTTKIKELSGVIAAGTTQSNVEILGDNLNKHIESVKEQTVAQVELVKEQAIQEIHKLEDQKASNIRYNWKFEIVDISQVPMEFLTVDEAKVKEWMKNNKDLLKEETSNGIRFYKEASVVTK
jgi:hypothetical protein